MTEENKREYVDLMIKWRMERGVGEQMKQLVDGFNEVRTEAVCFKDSHLSLCRSQIIVFDVSKDVYPIGCSISTPILNQVLIAYIKFFVLFIK